MPEINKMQRDQATILAIIKYALFAALLIGVIFLSFKLFYLLLPFLAGLVLARTSIAVANRIHPVMDRFKKSTRKRSGSTRKNASALAYTPAIEVVKTSEPKEAETAQTDFDSIIPPLEMIESTPAALLNVRWAISIYTILVFGLIALIVGVIFATIAQLRELAAYLPQLFSTIDLSTALIAPLKSLEGLLGGFLNDQTIQMIEKALVDWQNGLVNAIPTIVSATLNSVGIFVGNLPAIFLAIIVILLSGYYFITDSANLYRFLDRSLNNQKFLAKSVNLFNILSKTLLRVIGGYMLLLIITFIMALIGLLIIKMPYAVIFALIAAVIDFLPVLGISATMIPIAIYLLLNGQLWGAVGAIITLVVITLVRRFIEPPILGNALRLHPMATLFSMIAGVAVYGFSGILVGPVIMVITKEILSEFGFDQKIREMTGNLLNKIFD